MEQIFGKCLIVRFDKPLELFYLLELWEAFHSCSLHIAVDFGFPYATKHFTFVDFLVSAF